MHVVDLWKLDLILNRDPDHMIGGHLTGEFIPYFLSLPINFAPIHWRNSQGLKDIFPCPGFLLVS